MLLSCKRAERGALVEVKAPIEFCIQLLWCTWRDAWVRLGRIGCSFGVEPRVPRARPMHSMALSGRISAINRRLRGAKTCVESVSYRGAGNGEDDRAVYARSLE